MKVTTELEDKVFTPIILTIRIESEDELLDLYHRSNLAHTKVYDRGYVNSERYKHSMELWNALSRHVEEL